MAQRLPQPGVACPVHLTTNTVTHPPKLRGNRPRRTSLACAPAMAQLDGPSLEVLVYCGEGAGHQSARNSLHAVQRCLAPGVEARFLDTSELLAGTWLERCLLFIMPGGADLPYCKHLNGLGNRLLRAYVEGGGAYLGICAGAYYACSRVEFERGTALEVVGDRELGFFPGTARGAAYPGFDYRSEKGACAAPLAFRPLPPQQQPQRQQQLPPSAPPLAALGSNPQAVDDLGSATSGAAADGTCAPSSSGGCDGGSGSSSAGTRTAAVTPSRVPRLGLEHLVLPDWEGREGGAGGETSREGARAQRTAGCPVVAGAADHDKDHVQQQRQQQLPQQQRQQQRQQRGLPTESMSPTDRRDTHVDAAVASRKRAKLIADAAPSCDDGGGRVGGGVGDSTGGASGGGGGGSSVSGSLGREVRFWAGGNSGAAGGGGDDGSGRGYDGWVHCRDYSNGGPIFELPAASVDDGAGGDTADCVCDGGGGGDIVRDAATSARAPVSPNGGGGGGSGGGRLNAVEVQVLAVYPGLDDAPAAVRCRVVSGVAVLCGTHPEAPHEAMLGSETMYDEQQAKHVAALGAELGTWERQRRQFWTALLVACCTAVAPKSSSLSGARGRVNVVAELEAA